MITYTVLLNSPDMQSTYPAPAHPAMTGATSHRLRMGHSSYYVVVNLSHLRWLLDPHPKISASEIDQGRNTSIRITWPTDESHTIGSISVVALSRGNRRMSTSRFYEALCRWQHNRRHARKAAMR